MNSPGWGPATNRPATRSVRPQNEHCVRSPPPRSPRDVAMSSIPFGDKMWGVKEKARFSLRLPSLDFGRLQFRPDQHLVQEPVGFGLVRGHEKVAIGIVHDGFERLASVESQDFVQPIAQT